MVSYTETVVYLQRRKQGQDKSDIPFPKSFWSCYQRFHLQRLYPNVSTSQLQMLESSQANQWLVMPVPDLKPRAFKYWVINVLNHLNLLPGAQIHVAFHDYQYEYETPSKSRDTSEQERIVSGLDQEMPDAKEQSSFLSNEKNNLLTFITFHS